MKGLTLGLGMCQSFFGATTPDFEPGLVADFVTETYRKVAGTSTTFDGLLTHASMSNATMVDSDGLIKWAPHNLVLQSEAPATQSISVVSGAKYTVECTGVSIALSGAGSGTVTAGNPVEITASTTTLTLTVTGSTGTMWAYRSDLGGMVNNPDTGNSYVPTTSAARYLPRRGHHVYNGSAWVNEGLLVESEARTNLLLNSGTLSTQSVTVAAVAHTLSFTGTGTVTLSGASTTGPLVGTGTGENNRVSLTFTPTAGSLTLTVSGTVTNAQLEAGSTPSSYIPTAGATATRAAETLVIPSANLPWSSTAVSIAMDGRMTYADTGSTQEVNFHEWARQFNSKMLTTLNTSGSDTGSVRFVVDTRGDGGLISSVSSSSTAYSPGINVPFNIASRHGSTFINGAVDGVALTANLTPTVLPDLSATNLQLGYTFMGVISKFRVWSYDLGDTGIAEASA